MTDNTQPEALRLAALLDADEWPGSMTLVSYARECVAELRRQHGELETLRTGYAAARLEIESLKSQLAEHASHGQAPAPVLHLVNDAFAEVAMAYPKAFALHKVGIADTAVREALAAPAGAAEPTEQQILEAAFAPAQPAVEASRFGGPELQAMIIARCVEKDLAGSVLEDAAPAHAGEYPALVCDYCGALTPDPWHSSGMLHGKMSKHIHSCDACCRGATQPSPAAQGDALDAEVLRDAERYRFIRDVPYSDDVRSVLVHQQNAAMDRVIDAARAAQEGKSHD